ncbi:MAG TPA: hypothetical protein VEH84_15230 [Alphaproteobacteria bacterium]|nr:hypothetical protein [Alphaproteobacteria bacterium]
MSRALALIALLLAPPLAGCADWNWRETGRAALLSLCRSAENCGPAEPASSQQGLPGTR